MFTPVYVTIHFNTTFESDTAKLKNVMKSLKAW